MPTGSFTAGYRPVFAVEWDQSAALQCTANDCADHLLRSGTTLAKSVTIPTAGIVIDTLARRVYANLGPIRSAQTPIELAGAIASRTREQL
jgi:hypothetical protein